MLHRVCDTRRRSLRNTQQCKRFRRIDHGDERFQILDLTCERKIAYIPVGHSTTPFIVTNAAEVIAEETDPVTPNRTLPLVFEVSHPICGFDQSRARTRFCPRELNAVGGAEIPNSLCRPLDHLLSLPRQKSHTKVSEYIQTGTKLP